MFYCVLCDKNYSVNTCSVDTYCTYKSIYETELYVYRVWNRAQFRTGILLIKIETGKFTQSPLEIRLRAEKYIEYEKYFLFECIYIHVYYHSIRNEYYNNFSKKCQTFYMMNNDETLKYLMCADVIKLTAELI